MFAFQITDSHRLRGWLRQEFFPNIYNQEWYNGDQEKTDVYIANKMSILVGMPWMRQLRVKKSKPLSATSENELSNFYILPLLSKL